MPKTPITLTTDFGNRDPFVGTMKGVILGIHPDATIVDLTHEVASFDVEAGSFAVEQAYSYFPKGTVHVAVVDPGVGSSRRPIVVSCAGQYFVGPDNGIFSFLFDQPGCEVRELSNPKWRLSDVSSTFHGRDIFAPAAAHLARGAKLKLAGKPVTDPVPLPSSPETRVIAIDHFGNLITNVRPPLPKGFALEVGGKKITRLVNHYAEAPDGRPCLIIGSSGRVEIFIKQGSAAARLL